jgi:hypothetical protein
VLNHKMKVAPSVSKSHPAGVPVTVTGPARSRLKNLIKFWLFAGSSLKRVYDQCEGLVETSTRAISVCPMSACEQTR